jgi:hypothetical protein
VSKSKDAPNRSGRSSDWLEMTNADTSAVKREEQEEWDKKNDSDRQEPDHDLGAEN